MHPSLPAAVDAERRETNRRAARLSFYAAGDGPPLLLLHSINAAGSVFEVRPIFAGMQRDYRVYAPDLPGFGFSDRSARPYDVTLYVDAILDMLDVIAEEQPGAPVHALALSLSAEFLARAATQASDRFASLALVNPTGFSRGADKLRAAAGETREMAWLASLLEFPLWRSALYRGLVRPSVIRFFLKKTWGSSQYDEDLAAYDDLTTHQPGAEHAPYAFLSGRLFSRDIRTVYESLQLPVWLPHGIRGDFKDFSEAEWARQAPNWQVQSFATGALPHFEQTAGFLGDYRRFLTTAVDGDA